MSPEKERNIEFLKQVMIFNELHEDQLDQVADRLNSEFVKAGEVIYSQGDARDHVYLIYDGEVRVSQIGKNGTEFYLANFDYGDLFGEDALYFQRPRSTSATAVTDTELRYLSESDFFWLRDAFPQVEPYLNAFTRTHEIVRKLNIQWLIEGETISLADQRHPSSMYGEMLLIFFLIFFVLTISIALTTFIRDVFIITVLSAGMAGIVTVIGVIACIFRIYEWRNDYFFVTNLRVVWRERVLFRASSRQEVPFRRIQSLDVETSNFVERLMYVGDVVIRTFNSEMRLTMVNHPDHMKNMIDSFMKQAQTKHLHSEQAVIRRTIRSKLGTHQEDPPPIAKTPITEVQSGRKPLEIFDTRIIEGDMITYRKHWWKFLSGAWKPSLALFISIAFVTGLSSIFFRFFGSGCLLIFYLVPIGMFLWWLYAYADWRNDIYKVTKDRVIDRDKKPFGKESFRSAPISNIQSVGHEIPNTIGMLLNVGNVRINVGEEILTFDGVHNPAQVHQDISRRMEEHEKSSEKNRIKQEHARMATWLDIYHDETKGEFKDGSVEHIPDFE